MCARSGGFAGVTRRPPGGAAARAGSSRGGRRDRTRGRAPARPGLDGARSAGARWDRLWEKRAVPGPSRRKALIRRAARGTDSFPRPAHIELEHSTPGTLICQVPPRPRDRASGRPSGRRRRSGAPSPTSPPGADEPGSLDGRVRGRRPTGHQATHEAGNGFRFLFRAPAGLRNLDVTDERALDTTGPRRRRRRKGMRGRQGSTREGGPPQLRITAPLGTTSRTLRR